MDLYTLALAVVVLAFIAYVLERAVHLAEKNMQLRQQQQGKKDKNSSFQEMVDNIPFALEQTRKMYNETMETCEKQGLSLEDAKKALDPIEKRIKLLETLQTWEPAVRVGANIADKGAKALNKIIDNIGKGEI